MHNFSRRYLLKLVSGILLSTTSYNVAARNFKSPQNVIIMLDPGHGGKDPGAIGPKGTKEKDIVLDIAKKTQHFLKKVYNLNSLLTRENDVFIDLKKESC